MVPAVTRFDFLNLFTITAIPSCANTPSICCKTHFLQVSSTVAIAPTIFSFVLSFSSKILVIGVDPGLLTKFAVPIFVHDNFTSNKSEFEKFNFVEKAVGNEAEASAPNSFEILYFSLNDLPATWGLSDMPSCLAYSCIFKAFLISGSDVSTITIEPKC